ncbi:MAG: hypothetical protein IT493_14790 [Gammaproteobacteria bacterium]|nr:hypothetical protein [Gammaproteobacteria bacterium]
MPVARFQTPLEACRYQRISHPQEIAAFLNHLAAASDDATCTTLGWSVRGLPIRALLCQRPAAHDKPRVLLVGSHHGGSEPAGGEALLDVSRALLHGHLRELLDVLDVLVVPDVNPDGRDNDSSRNANRVNLNRDYVLLSQPESRALDAAVQRYRPHAVLDAHESAALKRKSLGRAGWLTEFEAQFDVANNPALPAALQRFGQDVLLNEVIDDVDASGLGAHRYIREILSLEQPLTHGGIGIARFRNKAGALGALSFLLETRLDPKDGRYPSFRNIEVRTAKQIRCIGVFLGRIAAHAGAIVELGRRRDTLRGGEPLIVAAHYAPPHAGAMHRVPLRRIDTGEVVAVPFRDHRRLALHAPITAPRAYLVPRHTNVLRDLLWRHGLCFDYVAQATTANVMEHRVEQVLDDGAFALRTTAHLRELTVPAGTLRIALDQPLGRVAALLFEPTSTSSVFGYPAYRRLLKPGAPWPLLVEH